MGASGLTGELALLVGWGAALAAWVALLHLVPRLWPEPPPPDIERPWRSLAWVLGAMAATFVLMQLHARGVMLVLPGVAGAVAAAAEQMLMFLPILLVPSWLDERETRWLPGDRLWLRLPLGLALAGLALLAYAAPGGLDAWSAAAAAVVDIYNLPYAVRVVCQDLATAILFIRLRAVMGHGWAVALVAAGFAVAQFPSWAAAGDAEALVRLVLDGGLAAIALATVARSADLWWFLCVHVAMDTMQAR